MKRIHLTTLFATVLTSLVLSTATQAANEPAQPAAPGSAMSEQGKLDRHDRSFLKQAAEINLKEIQLGKLAEQRATDPNLKKLGAQVVKDHEENIKNLSRLAASKGVTLPNELSVWDRRAIDKLEKEQGAQFDKEFISLNTKGHEKALALYEKESARSQDPDIKAWAEKTIPALRSHLAAAMKIKPEAVAEQPKVQGQPQKSQPQGQPQHQQKKQQSGQQKKQQEQQQLPQ